MNHEDLLRQTLRNKAGEASADLTFAEIREGAAFRQRQLRRRRTTLLAAAAAVAIAVPASVIALADRDGTNPAPPTTSTPPATTTTPSPTTQPSTTGPGLLAGLPRSAAPGVTYLDGRTVHLSSGGTAQLPGQGQVDSFTNYHGGWLVVGTETGRLTWYDGDGIARQRSDGLSMIAVSADDQLTAFLMGDGIRVGVTTGMSEGEHVVSGSGSGNVAPVGFLRDGSLVYNDSGKVAVSEPSGGVDLAPIVGARAVSGDDRIAGTDSSGAGMVSTGDGTVLWRSADWALWAFSSDGKYVAATNSPTGGDFSKVAILDAATGTPVAQYELLSTGVAIDRRPVFDTDDTLLFVGVDTVTKARGILRLDTDGHLSRTTELVPGNDSIANFSPFVFSAGS